ncbi:MAG: hypothetical protein ACXWT4_10130, partial [Methylobacter sp.]
GEEIASQCTRNPIRIGITAISAVFFQQKPQKIARQILKSLSDQIKSFSQALMKNRLFQQNRPKGVFGNTAMSGGLRR